MRGLRISFALNSLALLGLTSLASGQFIFEQPVNYPIGETPSGIVAADLYQTGKTDLAVITGTPPALHIYINNGDKSLTLDEVIDLPRMADGARIAAEDMNNDGRIDLVITMPLRQEAMLLLNTSCFGLIDAARAPLGLGAMGLAIADIDFDGMMDVAVANSESNSVTIIKAFASPDFEVFTVKTGSRPTQVALGEFDFTLRLGLELAVLLEGNNRIVFFRYLGDENYVPSEALPVQGLPVAMIAEDFNRDGMIDFAIATAGRDPITNSVTVYFRTDEGFARPLRYPIRIRPVTSLVCGDFDQDGLADLMISAENNLTILAGSEKGNFQIAGHVSIDKTKQLFCVDLDNNGLPDVLSVNADGKGITVLFNGRK